MKFSIFSQYLERIEQTASRNQMTGILAELVGELSVEETDKACYLLLGRLGPLYETSEFNLADKMMIKVLAEAFNIEEKKVREKFKEVGDLGVVAQQFHELSGEASRSTSPAKPEGRSGKLRGILASACPLRRIEARQRGREPSVVLSEVEGAKEGQNKPKGKLEIGEVFAKLLQIAEAEGTGSQEVKIKKMAELLGILDSLGVRYVTRIPLGQLRLGFSDVTLIDALSYLIKGDKSISREIRQKFNVCPDIGLIARTLKAGGLTGLEKVNAEAGRPIRAALSARLPSIEKIVEKLVRFAVEPKVDGLRVQIHVSKGKSLPFIASSEREEATEDQKFQPEADRPLAEKVKSEGRVGQEGLFKNKVGGRGTNVLVKTFSRNMTDTTHMFPEIVAAAQELSVQSVILDGEAIAYNPDTEEFLPFQETMQRKRKYQVAEKSKQIPLKVFVFDILFLDGQSLLDKPFNERRKMLERIIRPNTLLPVRHRIVKSAGELGRLFDLYISEGLEGVMCKKLDMPYQAGARNFNWVKYKRGTEGIGLPDTVDGLVMGYYTGKGQRAKFGVGAFLVGVYNAEADEFETVAKVGTGLTDEQWEEFMQRIKNQQVTSKPKQYTVDKALACDFWVRPGVVVEVDADEITLSPVHTAGQRVGEAGLSLRFPRLVRFRDRLPEEVTMVEELLMMYGMRINAK
ncbi:ATP-dependent DNA ligase [Patescibacteria group bacterium]|nr:ATP-dependent DNA ligase [Patescibacteria group bacterium]